MTFNFARISIPKLPGIGKMINDTDAGHVLNGGDNYDQIFGNGGNDTIYLKGGIGDLGMGGAGNDKIYGGAGIDNIHGDTENDTVDGGAGNDALWGDEGNDTVRGGDGDDKIYFSSGKDTGRGDAGADTFVFDFTNIDGGLGVDTILDFHASGAKQDKLDLRSWGFKWAAHDKGLEDGFEIVKNGANTEIHIAKLQQTGTIILKNVSLSAIDAHDFII